jgi:hypothetical protein
MCKKIVVDKYYTLKKFSGKGGWTYAEIPEISQNKQNPFGWVTVSGFIDKHPINRQKLMPMGNDRLFLSVNKSVRNKIGKQAGDTVKITIYEDNTPIDIPAELIECFEYEDKNLYNKFKSLSESEKRSIIDWIYSAKTEETKAKRIAELFKKISETD